MLNQLIPFLCSLICFFGCNSSYFENQSIEVNSDTIKAPKQELIQSSIASKLDSYKVIHGVSISNYYNITDSLIIDLNLDGKDDLILLLSPFYFDTTLSINLTYTPKRLLLELINGKPIWKVRNGYNNIVSDVGGLNTKYNSIIKTKHGFEIIHLSGAKYSWFYSTEYLVVNNQVFLNQITKKCSIEEKESTIVYSNLNKKIIDFDINDTLSNNCGCDSIWERLSE